ncbi:hypothetical protein NUACC21_49010 [Scytonema sp. NUACC21]
MLNEHFYLIAAIAILVVEVAILTFNLFHKTAVWLEEGQLFPDSKANSPFFTYAFGGNVAIDGNTIVVGIDRRAIMAILRFTWDNTGAYVFVRDSRTGSWSESLKLEPRDYQRFARYGHKVAISGNRVVVGTEELVRTAFIFRRIDSP